ncbi:MAG: prolipoprotein diacylglyceryl transferase [Candidatus Omnitrophota bacterium]
MHPIVLKIGPFTIYSYGMMVAMAFLIGIYVASLEAVRKGVKKDFVYDLAFYLIIGSLIGARVYYIVFFNPDAFADPLSIFKVWQGGLAIQGGIFGGIITGLLYSRFRGISFWKMADLVAPSIILGQAIGRIGCFLNGCCFGEPTKAFFGVMFPKGSLADIAYPGMAVHPAQLYELIFDLMGFLLLWALRKRVRVEGGLFLLYLMLYASVRFFVSQFRGDNVYILNTNLKLADVTSAAILIIAMALFLSREKCAKK